MTKLKLISVLGFILINVLCVAFVIIKNDINPYTSAAATFVILSVFIFRKPFFKFFKDFMIFI